VSPHVGPMTDSADRSFGNGKAYGFIVFRSLVDEGLGAVDEGLRCRDRLGPPSWMPFLLSC
jgi:hypothetical protein